MDPKKVKKLNDLEVLKKLFNAVTEDDILVQKGNDLYINGKKIDEKTKSQLIVDAQVLSTMDLFTVLCRNMKHEANKMLYNQSKIADDMIFAKAMLFTVDIFEKKVQNLSRLS